LKNIKQQQQIEILVRLFESEVLTTTRGRRAATGAKKKKHAQSEHKLGRKKKSIS
jgi:hypothetical protein